jgi:hypothetical protein
LVDSAVVVAAAAVVEAAVLVVVVAAVGGAGGGFAVDVETADAAAFAEACRVEQLVGRRHLAVMSKLMPLGCLHSPSYELVPVD